MLSVQWYQIKTKDVKHLFTGVSANYITGEVSVQIFCPFLNRVFHFIIVLRNVLYIFIKSPLLYMFLANTFRLCDLSFHFLHSVFLREVFNFNPFYLSYFSV